MGFSPCLSRKRPSHGLGARLRWAFPPACRGKGRIMDLVCACSGLFPLPVEEKAVSWGAPEPKITFSLCLSRKRAYTLWAITRGVPFASFSPCLTRKRPSWDSACGCDGLSPLPVEEKVIMGLGVRLRLPFPPACRGKGCFMDLARVCDGLFPLPVEEKTVSWTLSAFAMAFSLCLSRKRPYRGRSCLFAIAFSLSGRRKRPVSGFLGVTPERPREDPESGQGAPEPKNYQF